MPHKYEDKILVTLLLVVSGNPAFHIQNWAPAGYAGIAVMLLYIYRKSITRDFFLKLLMLIGGYVLIFVVQFFNLGYISFVYILGFITKIIIGSIIFHVLQKRFASVFFDVLVVLCLLSFPFYLIHLWFGDYALSSFFLNERAQSIGIYTFRPQAFIESSLRNSGMFWEPGAFQAFINLCLFVNFYRMPFLLKNRKSSLFVLLLALASTQSTTGYIIFALIIGAYVLIYSKINKALVGLLLAAFISLCIYFFYTLDFLGDKIESQYELAVDMGGEYEPTRMGAFLFDLYYINKNPLTGNGFRPITRYADHPILIALEESGEYLGHGNGFSGFIASAGILGMLWYLLTITGYRTRGTLKDTILLCILMIVLLQGEHFLIYPFFLGIAFLKFTSLDESKASSTYHMPQ